MRLRNALGEHRLTPRKIARRVARETAALALTLRFAVQSALGRRALTDPRAETVVSLTSHTSRLARVHLAIESIARGASRPRAILLWVDSEDYDDAVALPSIRRLVSRGLDVRRGVRTYRAHNKYFGFARSSDPGFLVTADDDIFYPRSWLRDLWDAFEESDRACAVAYWVRIPRMAGTAFLPYTTWPDATDSAPRHGAFSLGVSGVIFPRALRERLARAGTGFLDRAPLADDVWISWCALAEAVPMRQCRAVSVRQLVVPGTQGHQLGRENVVRARNDEQIAATFSEQDRRAVRDALATGTGGVGRTRVAVFAPLYPPAFRGGGPVRSIEALTRTAPSDIEAVVLTSDRDLGASSPLDVPRNRWTRRDNTRVYYASTRHPWRLLRGLLAVRRTRPDIVHLNSFLNPVFSILPVLLWRVGFWGRPIMLVSPRGEFGDGALARHAAKKRAYLHVFRTLRIPGSVVWHSTAPHETAAIRATWGERAVVVERVNDTLLAPAARPAPPPDGEKARFVFLGRIVEHKGLAIVLRALKDIAVPVTLTVYGADEDAAYLTQCRDLVAQLPAYVDVTLEGTVPPEEVADVLHAHDVLVMPTAGENFGHVIAEALSASCFVLTTPWTPWTDILERGGGAVVPDRSAASWRAALEEVARLPRHEVAARRAAAGAAYEAWAAHPPAPHVWKQALRAARP